MARAESGIDSRARWLLHATEGDLKKHLGTSRLEVDLVGELYVRIREVLARGAPAAPGQQLDRAQLVDDLALAVYLAVVANDPRHSAGPDLLVELRRSLGAAIREDRDPPSDGAQRR